MAHPTRLTYIGHATLLIEMEGVRFLTDPLLRHRVWHLRRHAAQIDTAWYQNIDIVLISHQHWDHLDLASLKLLDRRSRLLVPRGVGPLVHRQGFERVTELTVGETLTIGPVTIETTYADHDGGRSPFRGPADCLGFIIKGSYTIYFAGDTDLFLEMADLAENLDVALLPVWGWGPNLGPGHLNPYRAAQALELLRPRLAIPIHWGTFFPIGLNRFMPHVLRNPPQAFARSAEKLVPEVSIQIISPGRSVWLDKILPN